MKGIVQQIEEHTAIGGPMTAKDMQKALEAMNENAEKLRKEKLAKIKRDTNHLLQRSKQLDKEIPWLLWYHASSGQTWWTSQEQLNEYSEWIRDETTEEKANRLGDKAFQKWLKDEYIKRKLDV